MRQRLRVYLSYVIFWLLFFWVSKLLFLVFNYSRFGEISPSVFFGIFLHGFPLDLSATGYIIAFPCFLLVVSCFAKLKYLNFILGAYTIILLIINATLLTADLELFTHWQYRLDATPLLYLDKPGEVFGSVGMWVIARQIAIGLLMFALFAFLYYKFIIIQIRKLQPSGKGGAFVFIMIFLSGFFMIRGGYGLVPVNLSVAYFHDNVFINQASVNLLWNVGNSLLESTDLENRYLFYKPEVAEKNVKEIFAGKSTRKHNILNCDRPNILFILIESFTAKAIGSCGGNKNITPCFDSLVKQGIFFTNFYASGNRSDKGIVSVISGFPAFPKLSIMKYPSKTQQLPFISEVLKKQGYTTAFYYGGDPDFANIRAYLTNGRFDKIISKKEFDSKDYNAKWGVHDHVAFERLFSDLNKVGQPFYYMLFTLSSHEPYDVPGKAVITGDDDESKFLNSLHYTDHCIGAFIEKAKKTSWWKNTLVILVADHGHRFPGNTANHAPESFRIPMLWLGGALSDTGIIISHAAAQTDIAASLLSRMGIDHVAFRYSTDIFSADSSITGYYIFNDGFGCVNGDNYLIYDNISRKIIGQQGTKNELLLKHGKSLLQVSYSDFIKK